MEKGKTLCLKYAFTKMFCPLSLTPDFAGRNLSPQYLPPLIMLPQKPAVSVKNSKSSFVQINQAYVCLYPLKINIKTDKTLKRSSGQSVVTAGMIWA